MLLEKDNSLLFLIDVQEKLAPLVLNHESIINRAEWVLKLAQKLSVPYWVCEQYPKGLGPTVAQLSNFKTSDNIIEKTNFSCAHEPLFQAQIQNVFKKQVIFVGIETHVCVLQSAMQCLDDGLEVYIVVDAVSSRNQLDHQYGLKRLKHCGAQLITSEMLFFEWIKTSKHPDFKALSKEFL